MRVFPPRPTEIWTLVETEKEMAVLSWGWNRGLCRWQTPEQPYLARVHKSGSQWVKVLVCHCADAGATCQFFLSSEAPTTTLTREPHPNSFHLATDSYLERLGRNPTSQKGITERDWDLVDLFQFQCYHLLTVLPWKSTCTFESFSFLICKNG